MSPRTAPASAAPNAPRKVPRILLRPPAAGDEEEFLRKVAESRALHRPWVYPPSTTEGFRAFLEGAASTRRLSYLAIERENGAIAGVFSLSEIVRGALESAYLGFYAFASSAGRGLMTDALHELVRRAFLEVALHRVEANIQPGNRRSLALVRRCGFRREGYSPRYLRIGGRWRDHERWAILVDDWKTARREARTKPGARARAGREGGATAYERIYAVVRRIPRGRVATYGQIASLAGLDGHARQVGYALHALRPGAAVPWHRVLNAAGRISLGAREGGDIMQRLLLEREGVRFDASGRLDFRRFLWKPVTRRRTAP